MKKKIAVIIAVLVLALIAGLVPALVASADTDKTDIETAIASLGMFSDGKFAAHLVVPNDDQVVELLESEGIVLNSDELMDDAVQLFREEWAQRNPTTPNPDKLEELLDNERADDVGASEITTQIMSLVVPMEFPNSETITYYGGTYDAVGPLHNEIPAPGARDNNTVWYEDATPEMYNQLYFGVGPTAGVIVNHPNLGTVDLRGSTMANYYLEQSGGEFCPEGYVYPEWLQAIHPEAFYGVNNETGTNNNINAADLVREAVDAINADDPDFPWQDYDGDGDGIVDNFTVIHAGMGEEAGGGAQGEFAIWSHASAVDYPSGYRACIAGTHGATQDIYVREYSMDPENLDVGVISEEYGHAAFGLPDLYATDYQGSPADWAIMESGSWNGILGGMQPAPFPLYFRYLVGWADPVELDYTTKATTIKVGQLSLTPADTEDGIKIDLPDQVIDIPNPLGTGIAWWSDRSDLADFYLAHDFDLTGATAPIFSFASYWSFEQDYDYGYVEVSTDGGATWTALADMDGVFVDDGMEPPSPGLNGEGQGTLRFDLTAYAGQTVTIRLHYTSDVGVQWAGWWADDFSLADGAAVLFSDDAESGAGAWTTNNFVFVPQTRIYPMYYLAEWRNNSGFDRGLKYAYQTVYNDDDEWEVDRTPYSVPGMLLWLRNAAYDFDYTLSDSWYDGPSYGPKHGLLVVDSHYWPLTWDNYQYDSTGADVRISARCQPSNAVFSLNKTTPFTIRLGYDPNTGDWADTALETKTFAAQPGIPQFHDSLGYYPGLWYSEDLGALVFWQKEASAVVPAQANYTTKITWPDQTPLTDFYGLDLGDTVLGTGNPRDDGVQYGVNLAVLGQARNGSWGTIAVWNATSLGKLSLRADRATVGPCKTIVYRLTVTNVSPATQTFTVVDPIPADTTYVAGGYYNAATKSIEWTGMVGAGRTVAFTFVVKVKPGTARGTVIVNSAALHDDASGSSAGASTKVK
jgi:immune inhibitor A